MMGSKPPDPPDRATPDADDLTKTRYGDPYSPPSAAGTPLTPSAGAPKRIAAQPVRAIGASTGEEAATQPARATESPSVTPPEPAIRTTRAPERGSVKPPALPSKRRSADSAPPEASPPSAAAAPAVPLEEQPILHGDQTRAAGSPEPVHAEVANRTTPEPERARGGADSEAARRRTPSPRLRMSRTDVFVPTPSLARRVYPRDTLIVPPRRSRSRWPLLSLLALALSVVALGVAIATLVPRWSSHAAKPTGRITDHRAATSPPTQTAGHIAQVVVLPEVTEHGAGTSQLTAAEPAPSHPARREAPVRRTRVEQLPPPVPSASKRSHASSDASTTVELEREARDRLAEGDYLAAKRIYERLRAAVPGRREYTAMIDLLTTRLASCGQPGAEPCPKP